MSINNHLRKWVLPLGIPATGVTAYYLFGEAGISTFVLSMLATFMLYGLLNNWEYGGSNEY